MCDEGEKFWNVLQWCKYHCIWPSIKGVGSTDFPMNVIILADELDDSVRDIVQVDNGGISVQTHSVKLVAVLHRIKRRHDDFRCS